MEPAVRRFLRARPRSYLSRLTGDRVFALAAAAAVLAGGTAGGVPPVNLADVAAGNRGFVVNGIDSNDNSGRSVSSAGDVNGDGMADLIVGAFYADPGGINSSLARAKVSTFPGSTLTNAAGHTIAGVGAISGELINEGLVVADISGNELRLTVSPKQNNATMMATNGGILSLFSGVVRGGVLDTFKGGSIDGGTGDGAMVEDITLTGNMNLRADRSITIGPLGLVNNGVILVNSDLVCCDTARVHVGVSTETTISGTGVLRLNSLTRAKVTIASGSTLTNADGHAIAGVGKVLGTLVNAGILEPGLPVGSFEVLDAPFTQTTTGRLRILISGSPASNLYGQLHCSNSATLAGIVEISADGFFPQVGAEYEIVVSDLFIQGEFTGVVGMNLPGLGFELIHDFDRVRLVVVMAACPADLDGDGDVGITDFLELLGNWGPCP